MNSNCSNLLYLRNLQEQVKKAFCYQKLFWPFTVWINCSRDLKNFANSWPLASIFKTFSQSLEHFFLTAGQNNFGNKIPKNMILLTICLLVIVMGAWWWCLNSKKKCGSFPTINNISTFAKGRKAAFSFWGHHGSSILMTHLPGNLLGKKSSNYHIINHLAKVLIYCKVTNHNQ